MSVRPRTFFKEEYGSGSRWLKKYGEVIGARRVKQRASRVHGPGRVIDVVIVRYWSSRRGDWQRPTEIEQSEFDNTSTLISDLEMEEVRGYPNAYWGIIDTRDNTLVLKKKGAK